MATALGDLAPAVGVKAIYVGTNGEATVLVADKFATQPHPELREDVLHHQHRHFHWAIEAAGDGLA